MRQSEFGTLLLAEELQGGHPTRSAQDGIGMDFLAGGEVDGLLGEELDVRAVDTDVLRNGVEEIHVVEETAGGVFPKEAVGWLVGQSCFRLEGSCLACQITYGEYGSNKSNPFKHSLL